jgi:hypothetical protein
MKQLNGTDVIAFSTEIGDAVLNWASGNHEVLPGGKGDVPESSSAAKASAVETEHANS